MPRLTTVDLHYGTHSVDVRFSATSPLLHACDTAVLQITDPGHKGSEFGIRIERGHVVDAYIWDAARRLRQRLPLDAVTIDGRHVSCSVPRMVLPVVHGYPRLQAALVVNGAPVQSRFPVKVEMRHTTRQRDRVAS